MFKSQILPSKGNHCCVGIFSFGLSKIRIRVGFCFFKCIVTVFLDMQFIL